jgi:hypothetical protein
MIGAPPSGLAQRVSGWIVTLVPPDDEANRWCVPAAQLDVILTETAVVAVADQFRALAAEFAAEYGGWKCEQSPAR